MNLRHKARELALQVLFQWDIHRGATGWLEGFWDQHAASPESRQFAQSLVDGVIGDVAELDALISRYAENWTISRMACIDRNVLRMAAYELLSLPEVPARVTLNEAIDIVKRFGDEQSGAFVNGILDRMLKEEPSLSVKAHESAMQGEKESVLADSRAGGCNESEARLGAPGTEEAVSTEARDENVGHDRSL
jgi:transcription antitermination protein NusB